MVASVSHNDHITFSTNKSGGYTVRMGRCSRTPLSFKKEAIKTARLIREHAGDRDIWLSYSGGIDSEFMVRTFIEAGVDFKIATAVLSNDKNSYDLSHSRQFCQKLNLNLHEVKIDLADFFETELEGYAVNTQCVSPQFPVHMKLWDQLDGFVVAGHGDPIFKRIDNVWYLQIQEKEDSVFRYAHWRNRDMAPGFFAYTPELLLSFILEKEISNMLITGNAAKLNDVIQVKHSVYSKCYAMEERNKQTGFEQVADLDSQHRQRLGRLCAGHDRKHLETVDHFIQQLWPHSENTEPQQ